MSFIVLLRYCSTTCSRSCNYDQCSAIMSDINKIWLSPTYLKNNRIDLFLNLSLFVSFASNRKSRIDRVSDKNVDKNIDKNIDKNVFALRMHNAL